MTFRSFRIWNLIQLLKLDWYVLCVSISCPFTSIINQKHVWCFQLAHDISVQCYPEATVWVKQKMQHKHRKYSWKCRDLALPCLDCYYRHSYSAGKKRQVWASFRVWFFCMVEQLLASSPHSSWLTPWLTPPYIGVFSPCQALPAAHSEDSLKFA